jgi:hypothetical protein
LKSWRCQSSSDFICYVIYVIYMFNSFRHRLVSTTFIISNATSIVGRINIITPLTKCIVHFNTLISNPKMYVSIHWKDNKVRELSLMLGCNLKYISTWLTHFINTLYFFFHFLLQRSEFNFDITQLICYFLFIYS